MPAYLVPRSVGDVAGLRVLVAGVGRSNTASALALAALGARLVLADTRPESLTADLAATDARFVGDAQTVPPDIDLVLTTPGRPPSSPLLRDAADRGVPVVGEVELAWRFRDPAVPWLGVTGSNGKTTTVGMLTAILGADGRNVAEVGNVGPPVLPAALDHTTGYDVFVVELSSFQLHWAPSLDLHAGALLNIAPDHLDWHGTMAAYAEDKARILPPHGLSVLNLDDGWSRRLGEALPAGFRRTGFTAAVPGPEEYGVRDDLLVVGDRVIAEVADVRPPGAHNVANALAAAALADSVGVAPGIVPAGLRAYRPAAHRMVSVATVHGVRYVDDSKATNAHAAAASLAAYPDVVWIAGGLFKGASVDELGELVRSVAGRLRGVVLLGRDRATLAEAIRRHAPDVPVREVDRTDDGAMHEAVDLAQGLARAAGPTVTVLLAPAAASMDMFRDYGARGEAFVAAVAGLPASASGAS